ncbi:MAG: pilus assembly PilX N-terminal domain-containing protein [Candidatus Xenobiia bacterium LiM19]
MKSDIRNSKRGFILGIVVVLLPIMVLLMATIIQSVIFETRFTMHSLNHKRAFYLAETAMNTAYYEFSSQRYVKTTHQSNGTTMSGTSDRLQISVPNVAQSTGDGWYEWTWSPGCSYESFNGGPVKETFRYRIYYPNSTTWIIEADGIYGSLQKRIRCIGTTETAFSYALFDDQNLSEFTRGANQTISGKVHANGDMYFRPDGSTLQIYSTQVTAAGKMVRFKDIWGRPDTSGTVKVTNTSGTYVTMDGASQGASGIGNAFDSYNSNWTSSSSGALSKWGGVMKDVTLGAGRINAPSVQSFEPGGYYDQNAGTHITSTSTGTGLSKKTFTNKGENHSETVIEIDLSTYTLPSNGLLYCTTPVRFVNGGILTSALTVVSTCNIYTKGDFNKTYGTQDAYNKGTVTKQPVALMTKSRIYHVSKGWNDSNSANSTPPAASDTSSYTGDPSNIVEINACLVDGSPTVSEINYRESWLGVTNPLYNPVDKPGGSYCWANSDDFLETFGSSITVKKRGSIVHLENATMCNFSNSDYEPGKTAWKWKTSYTPPTRDYGYDSDLSNPTKQPPFAMNVGKKLYWKEVY